MAKETKSNSLIAMFSERFASIDYEQVKQNVFPFIKHKSKLDFCSAEYLWRL